MATDHTIQCPPRAFANDRNCRPDYGSHVPTVEPDNEKIYQTRAYGMVKRHVLVALTVGWVTGLCCLSSIAATDNHPNIVIIVADDLGWADVSFHGDQIKTPNLKRLVDEGAELSRFYVCPVCSPTRAGLMTGRYPIRYGLMRAVVPPWRKGGLDPAEVTLPEVLAKAGYHHRGIFGKWHLGHSHVKYHPLRRGFTDFLGHYNGAIDYFTHHREGELDWHDGYDSSYDKGYSTDLIADAAVKFIQRHAGADSPFFCYVPFNAPHGPLQARADDLQDYDHLANQLPRFNVGRNNTARYGAQGRGESKRQTLAAMISRMDQAVGRILAALQANQLADNTLVWFFSDNGGTPPGDNLPLNGKKGTVFEGGIRVAAAARWPGRIVAGSKIDVPLAYIDVLPTLMHVAGIKTHGGKPLDGVDAFDVLTGTKTQLPRDLYSYIGQQGEAAERITVIEPTWKLIVNGPKISNVDIPRSSRQTFLYRIASDPYESENVVDQHPDIVDRMWRKLVNFRSLQPANAIAPYQSRDKSFTAPREWKIPNKD
jgi:arylsulfatase B